MAFDRFKGQAQDVAGRVQSAVGDMTGDHGVQAEGAVRQVGGQAQEMYGAAKNKLQDASENISGAAGDAYRNAGDYAQGGAEAVSSTVKQYPLSALLLAASFGFVAALMMTMKS